MLTELQKTLPGWDKKPKIAAGLEVGSRKLECGMRILELGIRKLEVGIRINESILAINKFSTDIPIN